MYFASSIAACLRMMDHSDLRVEKYLEVSDVASWQAC
jgi:hypothetical protein